MLFQIFYLEYKGKKKYNYFSHFFSYCLFSSFLTVTEKSDLILNDLANENNQFDIQNFSIVSNVFPGSVRFYQIKKTI